MAKRPNFLVFMTDQEQGAVARPGHPCRTPYAEGLVSEGISFVEAYCPTAHCCPSRATFMTGLYPSRHGVYNNVCTPTAIHFGLNSGVGTFSEALREAGYRLVYVGKWHVSAEEGPADRGWEEVLVTAGKGASHHRSIGAWRDVVPSEGPRGRGEIVRPGWGNYRLYGVGEEKEVADRRIVDAALRALKELAGEGGPWFLFVGPSGPHDPYIVPERFVRAYDPKEVPLPPSYADTLEDKPRVYRRMREQYWGQLSEEEVREAVAHYWAYCTMMDEMFGEVLEALDRTGQADRTLVLRLSDHGDYAGAHGLFLKGVPAFREAYNIVAVLRWPEGVKDPGREVDAFVTLADFAPTFMELAGVQVPEGLTGRSLVPFLRGEEPEDWPDAFFSQFNGVELYYTQRIVRTKEYKYVFNGFDMDELYDLREDPHETVNLADRPEYREVKRELVGRMWRFAAEEGDELIFNPYPTVALAPWGPGEGLARPQDAHRKGDPP